MNILSFPRDLFSQALERLARAPAQSQRFALGTNHLPNRHELLVGRSLVDGSPPSLELRCVGEFEPAPGHRLREPGVLLEIGRDAIVGQAAGVWLDGAGLLRRLELLALPGAGMHVIPMEPGRQIPGFNPGVATDPESRTARALGQDVVGRLSGLTFGVIGVGRTGTRVARGLAQFVPRQLALIDPDVLERHNLREVDGLGDRFIGQKKARTVAVGISEIHPTIDIRCVEASVASEEALAVLRGCDVIICCADHDGARLAATLMCSLFHKVLIDIATGVHRRPEFRMAADVRVLLPGNGCLLCVGGLPDEMRARVLLGYAVEERTFQSRRNWRTERAGSLASLNQLAVGLSFRALEDVVSERVRSSFWTHLEYDVAGRARIEYPARQPRSGCACRFAGLGAKGLSSVPGFLQERSST